MKRRSRLAAIMAIAAVSLGSAPPTTVHLSDFSRGLAGWSVHRIDRSVPLTRFRTERIDGRDAVVAEANSSMGMLVRPIAVDLSRTPILCWRWRIASVVSRADITRKSGDDQAARVFIGLRLPGNRLSLGDRIKLSAARRQTTMPLPDATLNYVWDNRLPVGTVRPNVFLNLARVFVAESGNGNAGRWVAERRDIAADIQSQFRTADGRVTMIALSSDTDNTKSTATAAFADLHLVARDQPCG